MDSYIRTLLNSSINIGTYAGLLSVKVVLILKNFEIF